MEGAGSRLSRASSRYGPTAAVFNGPVRKWKKRWVHVSPPPSSTIANHHHHLHKAHLQPNASSSSTLFLCRWTPASSSAVDGSDAAAADEPPRRKYRYTPVAVLEDQSEAVIRKTDEIGTDKSMIENDETYENANKTEVVENEIKESKGHLDLGVNLDSPENVHEDDEDAEDKEAMEPKASKSSFWSMG